MSKLNEYPVVVRIPGGRVGGTNQEVKVNLTPTPYTGGKNADVKANLSPTPYKGGTNADSLFQVSSKK